MAVTFISPKATRSAVGPAAGQAVPVVEPGPQVAGAPAVAPSWGMNAAANDSGQAQVLRRMDS